MSKPRRRPSRLPDDNGTSADGNGVDRDSTGRFKPGNAAAKGRPSRRQSLEAALRATITEKDIREIVQRLVTMALKQNSLKAAELVLNYALGKPRRMAITASSGIALGELKSIGDCATATARITTAVAAGAIALEEAQALASLVELVRVSHEGAQIETRLRELEERMIGETQ